MKNIDKLANKLVALGVGEYVKDTSNWYLLGTGPWISASQFISDPRVMAAMLELVRNAGCEAWCRLMRQLMDEYHAKDINLAITSTCVELIEEL